MAEEQPSTRAMEILDGVYLPVRCRDTPLPCVNGQSSHITVHYFGKNHPRNEVLSASVIAAAHAPGTVIPIVGARVNTWTSEKTGTAYHDVWLVPDEEANRALTGLREGLYASVNLAVSPEDRKPFHVTVGRYTNAPEAMVAKEWWEAKLPMEVFVQGVTTC